MKSRVRGRSGRLYNLALCGTCYNLTPNKQTPPETSEPGGCHFQSAGSKTVAHLLAQASVIRNSCDLDLLVFLHRHPRSFLTSEQLATFLGYPLNRVAESLDSFISAALLERTQNPLHAARLYLLQVDGPRDEGLRTLLQLGATRPGRRRRDMRSSTFVRYRTSNG